MKTYLTPVEDMAKMSGVQYIEPYVPEKEIPSAYDTIGSAMNRENLLFSYRAYQKGAPTLTDSERDDYLSGVFNPLTELQKPEYEGYAKNNVRFADARSKRELDFKIKSYDKELEDQKILDEASGWVSYPAMFAAGMVSPENFLPVIGAGARVHQALKLGINVAAPVAAGELALHATQETRTLEESLFAVTASTAMTAGIVGALGKFKDAKTKKMLGEAEEALQIDIKALYGETSAGAAEVTGRQGDDFLGTIIPQEVRTKLDEDLNSGTITRDEWEFGLREAQMKGLEVKLPNFVGVFKQMSPSLRVATAQNTKARLYGMKLMDDMVMRNMYSQGLTPGASAETIIRQAKLGNTDKVRIASDELYAVYKAENENATLSSKEFREEVFKARNEGDKHEIPQVAELAKQIREIDQEMLERAFNVGMVNEVTSPFRLSLDMPEQAGKKRVTDRLKWLRGIDFSDSPKPWLQKDIASVNRYSELSPETRKLIEDGEMNDFLRQKGLIPEERVATDMRADESYSHHAWDFGELELKHGQFIETYIKAWNTENAIRAQKQYDIDMAKSNKEYGSHKEWQDDVDILNSDLKRLYDDRSAFVKILDESRVAKSAEDVRAAEKEIAGIDKEIKTLERRSVKIDRYEPDISFNDYQTKFFDADEVDVRTHANDWWSNLTTRQFNGAAPESIASQATASQARGFDLPSKYFNDFMVKDVLEVQSRYYNDMYPKIVVAEMFGDIHMQGALKEIDDEYAQQLARTDLKPRERKRLVRERESVPRDLVAVRDVLYGTYGVPSDPNSAWVNAAHSIKAVNTLSLMGGVVLSALPDVMIPIVRMGIGSYLKNIAKLAIDPAFRKAMKEQGRVAAANLDLSLSSAATALARSDTANATWTKYNRHTTVAVDGFYTLNGMNLFNASAKTMIVGQFHTTMLAMARKGELSRLDLETLAQSGISKEMFEGFKAQMIKHGDQGGEYAHLPALEKWDADARSAYLSAVNKVALNTVISPGAGQLPLFMRTTTGSVVGQFLSWSMAATQSLMISGVQRADNINTYVGLMGMVAMGTTSYILKELAKGNEVDFDDTDKLIREGIDRSGALAIVSNLNLLAEKATGGEVSVYKPLGLPTDSSRYSAQNLATSILGVTPARVNDMGRLAYAASEGNFTQANTEAAMRFVPLQNLYGLNWYNELRGEGVIADAVK